MAVGAMGSLETDYLVIGAGAMGMAFTDALVDHADVHVTLVDRRHATGGHWLDAYPFVQLHQASLFYGVASTVLGTGAIQWIPDELIPLDGYPLLALIELTNWSRQAG